MDRIFETKIGSEDIPLMSTFLIAFHSKRMNNLTQSLRLLERNDVEVVANSQLVLLCQDACGEIPNRFLVSQVVNLNYPFMQKSRALNLGVSIAKSDKIVILDSDRILPHGYFNRTLSTLLPGTARSVRFMRKLRADLADEIILSGDYDFECEDRDTTPYLKHFARGIFSGNVCLFKQDYWTAGGMDETYEGYGFEDSDMTNRLTSCGITSILSDDLEVHLHHPVESYGGDHDMLFLKNGLRYCHRWSIEMNPVLNNKLLEAIPHI